MVKSRIWYLVGALGLVALLLSDRGFAEKARRTQHAATGAPARAYVGKHVHQVAKEHGPAKIRGKKKMGQAQNAAPGAPARAYVGKHVDQVAKEHGPVRSAEIRRKKKTGPVQNAEKGVSPRADMGTDTDREPGPVRSILEIRQAGVVIQNWDLSCGAAALGTLLRYEFGEPVTEKEIARGLISRGEYIEHPELVQIREGFSLLDLKRYVQTRGYKGLGFGQLDLNDLVKRAPIMVPINALGYNHFVIFRGIMGGQVLLADPAWGNRTMTLDKFQRMWLDYGEPMGHVGFVVERADGRKPLSRLQPRLNEFVMLQ